MAAVPDRVTYLTLFVVLKNPKEVKKWQDWCRDNNLPGTDPPILGYVDSPNAAAARHSAPFKGYDDPKTGAPYTWTPWKTDDKGNAFPLDQAVFQIKSGGFWIFGGTVIEYRWLVTFVLWADPDEGTVYGPLRNRRWIYGFESGFGTVLNIGALYTSPDAARHVGGLGLALRNGSGTITHPTTQYAGGSPPQSSWERFYLRLRRKPDATTPVFWKTAGSPSANAGIQLAIAPSGDVLLIGSDVAGTLVTIGTVVRLTEWHPVDNPQAWRRFDIYLTYNPNSHVTISVDGFPVYQQNDVYGLKATAFHQSSAFVAPTAAADLLELDVDDWMNADWGGAGAAGKDVYFGSKIVRLTPLLFSANHNAGAWTGDVRVLAQRAYGTSLSQLTSSTSGAICAVTVNDAMMIDADTGKIGGAVALLGAGAMAKNSAPNANGQIGLSTAVGATVVGVTESTLPTGQSVIQNAGGAVDPPAVTPIEVRRVKGADANPSTTQVLSGEAELVGAWSKIDLYYFTPEFQAAYDAYIEPIWPGQHNWSYPWSPWAVGGNAPPLSPIMFKLGTYVGNGTGQDLAFPAPVNWLFIRRVSAPVGTYHWWTGMLGSHQNWQSGVRPQVPLGMEDVAFVGAAGEGQQQQYLLRIAGNDASNNALGITYEYVAVGDPGMRYMLNFAMQHKSSEGAYDNRLITPDWTPEFALFFAEDRNGAATTARLFARGPNSQSDAMSSFTAGGATTNSASFAAGLVTTKAGMHAGAEHWAVNCWRHADGNNDPDQAGVLQVGGYTGDGAASRTIGLTPSGKRPVFAMVFTEAAGSGYWRDPSHTGTNSGLASTMADNANGITAGGIDSFSVGTGLNANGVRYNYLVFMGDATACNNGWGCNGTYFPGGFYPPGGPWPPVTNPPPTNPPPVPPNGGGGPGPSDPPGNPLDPECEPFTRVIVNQALARIGVSKQCGDLNAETTVEANSARLLITTDVETTLRDVPWPFATKYAALALVSGSPAAPVNTDWVYAYRRPSNCLFERRIVVTRGTSVDAAPPPFAQGSDSGGSLIYCNVANAVLEYTAHPTCATKLGDPLYKEALIWRHAASLAPALTRMEGKTENALAMYERTIAKAWLIIKPGYPGATVSNAIPLDTTAAQITANIAVVNRAYVRIGARTISTFNDQSREAQAALVIFEEELRSILRDFPWAFATRYATLSHVAGDPQTPINKDWTYSYRVPVDCVMARRLVTDSGRRDHPLPPMFRLAQDGTGGLLYTNHADPIVPPQTDPTVQLEYTARLAGAVLIADPLFRDAFAWRLAASLAPSLAYVDPTTPEQEGRGAEDPQRKGQRVADRAAQIRAAIAAEAWRRYTLTVGQAKVPDANEQQQDLPEPDAPWIRDRN